MFTLFTYLLFPCNLFTLSMSSLNLPLSSFTLSLLFLHPFNVITLPFSCHLFTLSSSPSLSNLCFFLFNLYSFLAQSLLLPCSIFTPSLSNLYSFLVQSLLFLVQSLLLPYPIFTPSLLNLYSFHVQSLLLPCSIFTPSLSNLYSFLVQSLLLPCPIVRPSLHYPRSPFFYLCPLNVLFYFCELFFYLKAGLSFNPVLLKCGFS